MAHIRGDVTVRIKDADYTLRPNFEAIAAIEAVTGKSFIELGAVVSRVNFTAMAQILYHGLQANPANHERMKANGIDFVAVGNALTEDVSNAEGGKKMLEALTKFLMAYTPQSKKQGEQQAQPPAAS